MNHKIIQTDRRIEAVCSRSRGWDFTVIAFAKRGDNWTCATSVCLPSNIEDARKIHAAMAEAFKCLDEVIDNEES